MVFRKIAIRVLFASLVIAALAGVATLFAPNSNHIIGRLIGTAIATAISAALLLVAIRALEQTTSRTLGTILGILVCCIYIATVSAIWLGAIQNPTSSTMSEKMGLSALLLGGCGIPLMISAACLSNVRLVLAGKATLVIWFVLTLGWLTQLWFFYVNYNMNLEFLLVPLAFFSPIIALVLINRLRTFVILGLFVTCIGCIGVQISLVATGGEVKNASLLFLASLIFGWGGAELGIMNLLRFRPEQYGSLWLERIAGVVVGIALAALCIIIWHELNDVKPSDFIIRIASGTGILSSVAVLGITIGQVLKSAAFAGDKHSTLQAICPRCTTELIVPQGKSKCSLCGLHLKLQIESAGCRKCGYNLSGSSNSTSCPECGEPISIEDGVE